MWTNTRKGTINTKIFTIHLYKYLTHSINDANSTGASSWVVRFFFLSFFFESVEKQDGISEMAKFCVLTSLSVNPVRLFGTLRDPEGVALKGAVEHFGGKNVQCD